MKGLEGSLRNDLVRSLAAPSEVKIETYHGNIVLLLLKLLLVLFAVVLVCVVAFAVEVVAGAGAAVLFVAVVVVGVAVVAVIVFCCYRRGSKLYQNKTPASQRWSLVAAACVGPHFRLLKQAICRS